MPSIRTCLLRLLSGCRTSVSKAIDWSIQTYLWGGLRVPVSRVGKATGRSSAGPAVPPGGHRPTLTTPRPVPTGHDFDFDPYEYVCRRVDMVTAPEGGFYCSGALEWWNE